MSVSTKQSQILMNFMEAHGDLDLENPLWDQLTGELNKAGTPLSRDEWADVWKLKKIKTTRFFSNYVITESKKKLRPVESKMIKILGLTKETILKKNSILSNSVHSYYAELYVKNKRNLSNESRFTRKERKMMTSEAKQSWLNLPAAMKKAVILKHKQTRDLRDQKIADYLESVELDQLPVEPQNTTWEIKEYNPPVEDVANDANCTEEINTKETEDSTKNLLCYDCGDSPPHVMDDTIDNSLRSNSRANDYTEPPPPPPPPTVTTAEELYDLLQRTQGMEQIPWISLPETEKRQFRSAINSLKKDYLRQYRSYLHNLSSSDLHKHMVQTLFHDII